MRCALATWQRPGLLVLAAVLIPAVALCQPRPAKVLPEALPRPDEAVLFEELPVVEAASLRVQSLQEAPANVTVITAEEIRKYGYRTLGEALRAARGLYMTDDRTFGYVGLRGFLVPGDFNTRIRFMINGHYWSDAVYSSNGFFGQGSAVDMDLVKRIEIVRGPSSALYGSSGIFGTINVVTKSPAEVEQARISTELGSFGEKKAHVASSVPLGRGASLLVSGSAFNNAGQRLYLPEYDSPLTNLGWAEAVDGEKGYHSFVNLTWTDWSVMA